MGQHETLGFRAHLGVEGVAHLTLCHLLFEVNCVSFIEKAFKREVAFSMTTSPGFLPLLELLTEDIRS